MCSESDRIVGLAQGAGCTGSVAGEDAEARIFEIHGMCPGLHAPPAGTSHHVAIGEEAASLDEEHVRVVDVERTVFEVHLLLQELLHAGDRFRNVEDCIGAQGGEEVIAFHAGRELARDEYVGVELDRPCAWQREVLEVATNIEVGAPGEERSRHMRGNRIDEDGLVDQAERRASLVNAQNAGQIKQ